MDNAYRRYLRYGEYGITTVLMAVVGYALIEYASGTVPFYVISDYPSSMSPTLNYGDALVVYPAPYGSVRQGDIIAFHDPAGSGGVIIHRVVRVEYCGDGSTCLDTKGDNNSTNPTQDPWKVTQQVYMSKVILVLPFVGYVSPGLWGFTGYLVIVPLGFILLLALYLSARKSGAISFTEHPPEAV